MKIKKVFYSYVIAILIVSGTFLLGTASAYGQHPPYPIPGDTIENHVFYDTVNFPEGKRELKDFRGKWLLLDVWGYSCGSCINSFPKMDKLYQNFGDKIEIVMVGMTKARGNGSKDVSTIEKITKNLYTRLQQQDQLTIPVAFDSVFYTKYSVSALPQILIIDPDGVIRAKTVSVDSLSIAHLISGQEVAFEPSYSHLEARAGSDRKLEIPLLTLGKEANGGNDTSFIFRSLLSVATNKTFHRRVNLYADNMNGADESLQRTGRIDVTNSDLPTLYRVAYFGKDYWTPADTLAYGNFSSEVVFETSSAKKNHYLDNNQYTFSLSVPKKFASRKLVMNVMQSELTSYFGHKVEIEEREVQVYLLRVVDRSKLNSFKMQKAKWDRGNTTLTGFVCWDRPFKDFFQMLASYLHLEAPLIDNTTEIGNVRINFRADFLEREKVFDALLKGGLEISKGVKKMKVLVVKD